MMRKSFFALAAIAGFMFFSVMDLRAQSVPVADEDDLRAAIMGSETNLVITNDGFTLNGSVNISNYPSLYIHAASTPTNFSGSSSGQIFGITNSYVNFENIGFKNMDGNIFLRADGSNIIFDNAVFENNDSGSAETSFAFENSSTISFNGQTDFISNTGQRGGGFYAEESSVEFSDDVTFTGNKALFAVGGGFYAFLFSDVTFNGKAEFTGNSAVVDGGGAFGSMLYSTVNFNDAVAFTSNTAVNGGAFFVGLNGIANFNNSAEFNYNKAGGLGGAGYISESVINFSSSVAFTGNKAEAGGALAILMSTFDLSAGNAKFDKNEASATGGAVHIFASEATFQNAEFTDNKAGTAGGAIYVSGAEMLGQYGILNINTVNNGAADNKTIFQGNTVGGQSNAIYLDELSKTTFNTASGASVEMYDGIKSDTSTALMTVTGAGNFNLYADADLYNLELSAGNFNLSAGNAMNIVNLTADQNSVLNTQNASHSNIINVKNFNFDGTLKIDGGSGEGTDGDRVVAENAVLGTNSKLNIKTDASVDTSMDYRKRYYRVLNYEVVTGSFSIVTVNNDLSLASVSLTNEIMYADNWMTIALAGSRLYTDFSSLQGLSFNQLQVAKTFDRVSGDSSLSLDLDEQISAIDAMANDALKKSALLDASGYFLSNVIRSAATGSDRYDIYDRLKYHDMNAHNLSGFWAQARGRYDETEGDDNSRNKYKDSEIGALAGWDIMLEDRNMSFGFYGKYNKHDIKQENKNEATIEEMGLGFYGGYLKDEWEMKVLLSGSADNFETTRYIGFADRKAEGDFSGITLGMDLEGAIRSYVTEDVLLRPFVGLEVKHTSYDSFDEKHAGDLSLHTDSGDYSRSIVRIGLGISSDDDMAFEWYGNLEGKYLLTEDTPEITSAFASTSGNFKSKGAKEGSTIIGLTAGCSYTFLNNFKVFANANYQHAENNLNVYGNVGIRYMIK